MPGRACLDIDSEVAVAVMEHEDGEVGHLGYQRAERSRDDRFQLRRFQLRWFLHGDGWSHS